MNAPATLMDPGSLPEKTRTRLNGILSGLYCGYGPAFPASSATADGQLFVMAGALHQFQAGNWVAL